MATTLQLDLDERRAAALSRLLCNVTWSDLNTYAGNVEEALLMRDALDTIGRALVLGKKLAASNRADADVRRITQRKVR